MAEKFAPGCLLVYRLMGGLILGLTGTSTWAATDLDVPQSFNIPAHPLDASLRLLAKQAQLQILFAPALVESRVAPAVEGTMPAREALAQVLSGTHLAALEQSPGVLVVRPQPEPEPGPRQPARTSERESAPTGAQSAISSLEEVVVTAQRREERLQDVPISVSVYSRAAMDAQGTRSIDDIARLTPAITFTRGANNNNSESSDIAIRGISSNAGAATTGIYIDDTPIQSRHLSFGSFNTYPALFDLERVEVLRGPQGTLFGSGSEGGTIRFISPEPSLSRSSVYARSEIAATSHGDPVYELGVAGGTPIVDNVLGMRASVSLRREGGYIDRVDWHTGQLVDDGANANRTVTARVALKWAATDALTLTPSIYYQKRNVDDTSAWWSIRSEFEPGDPTNGQFNAPLRSGNEIASPDGDEFVLAALKAQWNLGAVTLFSSTSYFKRDQAATTDYSQYDRGIFLLDPYPPAGEVGTGYWVDAQKNWTQEFRLQSTDDSARVIWTAGLFYQHARETTRQRVYDPSVQVDIGLPADFGGGYIYQEDPRVGIDEQTALFGQADIRLIDPLTLTLGLRYARAKFEGQAHYPESVVVGPEFDSVGSEIDHPVTPKVGLTYRFDRNNLLYVTAAKGFRIGGANPKVGQACYGDSSSALGAIGLTDVPPTYGPDSVWSYEVGSKNSFADNRVQLNASAYYIKWKNIQQNVPLNACGFQYTGNLGEADSKGFDLQSVVKLNTNLSVGGTFSYTDAKFTQTVQLAPTVLSIVQDGDHLPASPWTLAAFAQATVPLFSRSGYVRADYQYSAKQTDLVATNDPLNGYFPQGFEGIPAQSFTSLRAGLTWSGWDVSLFAQNLFNTEPRLSAASIFTPYSLYTVVTYRPRTMGLTATYRY
jgi:iron complex outermembrane receptor protein